MLAGGLTQQDEDDVLSELDSIMNVSCSTLLCFSRDFFHFFVIFLRTYVLFVRLLIHLFWTSVDICPWFQSQDGSLACMLSWLHVIPQGETPADCIVVSMSAEPFLTHILASVSTNIGEATA